MISGQSQAIEHGHKHGKFFRLDRLLSCFTQEGIAVLSPTMESVASPFPFPLLVARFQPSPTVTKFQLFTWWLIICCPEVAQQAGVQGSCYLPQGPVQTRSSQSSARFTLLVRSIPMPFSVIGKTM
ncbi:unnamed protein product [Victoria cruziana]